MSTGVRMSWTAFQSALHTSFVAGMDYQDGVWAERLAEEVEWAKLAARVRASANEPSHEQLVKRRRRHQLEAAERARQSSTDWPESAA